jgi:hypothetical protein
LTMREIPDIMNLNNQEGITLELGNGFNEVRISISLLSQRLWHYRYV